MNTKHFLLLFFISIFYVQAHSAEFYVRPDGGTFEQCNGLVNQPYSTENTTNDCAVSHIFELLNPESNEVRISGGDTVNILNNSDGSAAEYIMGSHGEYTGGECSSSWAYDCMLPSIPSGTESNPTIIRGGLGGACDVKPLLLGINRAKHIMTITNAEFIEISCLTISDKSSCVGAHGYPDSSLVCDRSTPYDKPFADVGLYMRDASNISLTDLNIQGLSTGIHAGRMGNVNLERVNLFANHSAGWNGDIGSELGSSNTGTISFVDSSISFNGCGLIYNPGGTDHETPHACARQDIGGYGDGLGTASTGGDWVFDNVQILHNSSDGIDLLYHELDGTVTVKNSRIEGNAGNQLKVAGNSNIVNNLIIGSCGWNSRQVDALGGEGENCRAGGTALSLSYTHTDTKVNLINNTVYSEGDCIMLGGDRTGVGQSDQKITVVNNVFYGLIDYLQPFENTCLYYTEEPFPIAQVHNNLVHQVKPFADPCNSFQEGVPAGEFGVVCTTTNGAFYDNEDYSVTSNPELTGINLGQQYSGYDLVTLKSEASSPMPINSASKVINQGYEGTDIDYPVPTVDFYGETRLGKPDLGAIEYKVKPLPPVILNVIQN